MIKTVTLNPAVDKTVEIDNFAVGTVNRISTLRLDAGGKGINVAKVLKVLGAECKATGILAGHNGRFIQEQMDGWEIENDFVFIPGETRTNLKVVDPVSRSYTDINEPGGEVSAAELDRLEEKIFSDLERAGILILSGSVPAGVGPDIYAKWIRRAERAGVKTILDADGKLLREGIKARPALIKPNIHELEALLERKLPGPEAAAEAARELLAAGMGMAVVSMGAQGAVFVRKEEAYYGEAFPVEAKSTVGAGDAMVAALAYALAEGYSLAETVRLAVATSAAQMMTPGTQPPEEDMVRTLEKRVSYRPI
ncbi:1-phosphofructokinase [Acididesulfobacillus acetoxydans]|uniref:Tagatose-6-phosphate kinase n=1 Tax=Acididesulfobacillus acetoxydans TaxID=1561005 RepID=A0A8S0XV95_9FIRM|nr:1-phosphofructokinase [Acididesulfobacillus acetoxydans]CAA7600117.1 1-phosphofructokinase [Acididesulfobacillus acetoxydans]